MKLVVRTIVLLLIVNGLTLYFHYTKAGKADANQTKGQPFSQNIEVINRADALHIRQEFHGLPNRRIEITWPEASVDRSCYPSPATSCDRLNESLTAFIDAENTSQSISYIIPKTSPLAVETLYQQIFAVLHRMDSPETTLHIIDETHIGGMWVSGLKQVGRKKLELIDYTYFKGNGEITDLYWQQNQLQPSYEGEHVSIYGDVKDGEVITKIENALQQLKVGHTSIIVNDVQQPISTKRFTVTSEAYLNENINDLLVNQIRSEWSIPDNERMTAEIIASLLSEQPIGSVKSQKVVGMLLKNLSSNEIDLLTDQLNHLDEPIINATIVDRLIGEVTGYETSFFQRNIQEEVIYPFVLNDPRKVELNGKVVEDTKIILKDGLSLFPIQSILKMGGYAISSNEQSLYIESSEIKFRFPLRESENFYVMNDRRINTLSKPFQVIGQEFYFEETWFIRLFLYQIEKAPDAVRLTPQLMFNEEGDRP